MVDERRPADVVAEAQLAIGTPRPDDYRIAPAQHASELATAAPALARILSRSTVVLPAREFERLDAEAIEAQRRFKQTASRANLSVLGTACLSAALLVVGAVANALPEDAQQALLGIFALASVITGGLAAMWVYRLKHGHLFDRWMQARSGAEMRRHQYFERTTMEPDDAGERPADLLALQLEYFRRYQLDVQLAYYSRRGADHRRAGEQTLQLEAFAVLLASVATALAGGLAVTTLQPEFTSAAALGVFGAALAAYAATRENVSGDQRNGERYARTYDLLIALYERLDDVRRAASGGDSEALDLYVEAVQEQLSLEHRQWLNTKEHVTAGVARLEAALNTESSPRS